ncbi:MAG: hypothetical protein BWY59_01065 [Verrucomicrobia bacterium ADurb.Bin345]|nr:MAG: hypothetical protein BWY59_01065 [Verrucomicrobia bacterium ADurb.Bin345]
MVRRPDIEHVVALGLALLHQRESGQHVVNVDVRLALRAVAEDLEARRGLREPPQKVVSHAVRLHRPHDIGEAEHGGGHVEHETVRADERLARELARAVCRNRDHAVVVLRDRDRGHFAVYAAARGENDARHTRHAHRLQHVVRRQRSVHEIHGRLLLRPGDIRVRREVIHHVVTRHRLPQRLPVLRVGLDDPEPRVLYALAEMPAAPGAEVVENRDPVAGRVEQPVDEMGPDEAGPAGDEVVLGCLCHRAFSRPWKKPTRFFQGLEKLSSLFPNIGNAASICSIPAPRSRATGKRAGDRFYAAKAIAGEDATPADGRQRSARKITSAFCSSFCRQTLSFGFQMSRAA